MVDENPYTSLIEQLMTGEIPEIVVERDDFFTFREVWKEHPQRVQIVGEADLNGKIIYRYQPDRK
ncbi:hypothetical protein IV487_00915 [Enterococcus saccharolyticus]|uniref:Uncharacterized protein n=1 Tax=Candidatus Enterococcus willemsii TaxID=1857215 RepID=A0ABQ6Z1L4_9ENTE|nr:MULTISPECIES: hypothetical protein [Enterococcus]KAF1305392.1 hypothetical protein BAU17_02565 [Enterococcus sp. CU12B]MCD5001037.1 hypothetical protein [Enterococcus saccharolyticus]